MNKNFLSVIFTILCGILFNQAFAIEDDFVNSTLKDSIIEKPIIHSIYDYSDTDIIKIDLINLRKIKSEKDLSEGEILQFKVANNIYHNGNLILQRGANATARVETVIANGMNGIPASIIIGNFKVANLNPSQITGTYEKYGLDLSMLVFPIKWALTILPPTGSLTNFIKGGHVKLNSGKTITIYYHPNWL